MGFAWIPEDSSISPAAAVQQAATGARHSRRGAKPAAGGRLGAVLFREPVRTLLGLRASPAAATAWTSSGTRMSALNTAARHRSGLPAGG